jgi:hypothetical protein
MTTRPYAVGLFDTEDQREGVGALLAKRVPQWRNG